MKIAHSYYFIIKRYVFYLSQTTNFLWKWQKILKWAENTVGKGEIARDEQFLLFLSVFKRFVMQARKNQALFGKGLKHLETVNKTSFRNEQFQHLTQCCQNTVKKFYSYLIISL